MTPGYVCDDILGSMSVEGLQKTAGWNLQSIADEIFTTLYLVYFYCSYSRLQFMKNQCWLR